MGKQRPWSITVLLLVASALLLALRAYWITTWPVIFASDSIRYVDRAHPWIPFQAWEGGGPGVVVQLLYLLPDRAALIAQLCVAGAIWTSLLTLVHGHRRQALLGAGVVVWAQHPWLVSWDTWLITEPITIAAVSLTLVGAIAALSPASRRKGLVLLMIGVVLTVGTRPFIAPLALAAVVVVLLLGRLARSWRRALVAVLVAGTLVTGWQVYAFERLNSHSDLVSIRAQDRLIGRYLVHGYLQEARASGMPVCPDLPIDKRPDIAVLRHSQCPGYQEWLARGGLSWTRELRANPGPTISTMLDRGYWLRAPIWQYHFADERLASWRERVGNSGLRTINAVTYVVLGFSILSGIGVLAFRRRWRLGLAATTLAASCLGYAVLAWLQDGIEYWRHVLPALVGLGAIGWMCWVAALGGRTSRHRSATN